MEEMFDEMKRRLKEMGTLSVMVIVVLVAMNVIQAYYIWSVEMQYNLMAQGCTMALNQCHAQSNLTMVSGSPFNAFQKPCFNGGACQ